MSGGRVSIRAIYIGVAMVVATACLVNAFSVAHELARLGQPRRFWEPLVWEATSGALVIVLLALPRRGAKLAGTIASQPFRACASLTALALMFSAAHIGGMVALRNLAYAASGVAYSFNWSIGEIVYQLRKDVFDFSMIAMLFWLAERAFATLDPRTSAHAGNADVSGGREPPEPATGNGLWLRDGRSSILVDAWDILWVASAGNYVEYVMAAGRQHLIRSTLQAEETRLSTFGIARVHRTRLINLKRIVAIAWRPSGDFEILLDTGETISGSRRYKAAVAGIGTRQ